MQLNFLLHSFLSLFKTSVCSCSTLDVNSPALALVFGGPGLHQEELFREVVDPGLSWPLRVGMKVLYNLAAPSLCFPLLVCSRDVTSYLKFQPQ